MMETKPWYKSLTHWVNAAGAFLISVADPLSQALPSIQPYVGPAFYKYAFMSLAVANILIRQYRTKTAIGAPNVTPPQ